MLLLPIAAIIAAAPVPASYTVDATIKIDGQTVGTPALTVAAGTPAMIETATYRFSVTVTPLDKGKVQMESSVALPSMGEWRDVAKVAMPSTTGSIFYTLDGETTKVAVTVKATPAQ